jgi:hypothetical protein
VPENITCLGILLVTIAAFTQSILPLLHHHRDVEIGLLAHQDDAEEMDIPTH